jgi:hypothetical protein
MTNPEVLHAPYSVHQTRAIEAQSLCRGNNKNTCFITLENLRLVSNYIASI